MDVDLLKLVKQAIKKHNKKSVSTFLNIAPGTLGRWLDLESVPKQYVFDLLKLCDIPIDYSKFNSTEKDQFFTPIKTAEHCFNIFKTIIEKYGDDYKSYRYIEPSAGSGNFLNVLPDDTIALDIEPKGDNIILQDYLEYYPPTDIKYIVFGNPPFGLRGQLALKFINHSAKFADYTCFILPQLFESDGKGVPRKRVNGYNLIHSEKLNSNFESPDNKVVKVQCIFQIWSKYHTNEEYDIISNDDNIKVYSITNGNTPSSTRNKHMINKCDVYIPSTCFGKENFKPYFNFYDLPNERGYGLVFTKNKNEYLNKVKKIDWSNDVAFLSTNSAYNTRTSSIIKALK